MSKLIIQIKYILNFHSESGNTASQLAVEEAEILVEFNPSGMYREFKVYDVEDRKRPKLVDILERLLEDVKGNWVKGQKSMLQLY